MGTPGAGVIKMEHMGGTRPSLKTKTVDFRHSWECLVKDMTQVLMDPSRPPEVTISRHHDIVYHLCTSQCINLSKHHAEEEGKAAPHLLYANLKSFLIDYIENQVVRRVPGSQSEILVWYSKQWRNFSLGMYYMNCAFQFMNTEWIARQPSRNTNGSLGEVVPVGTLGHICWRDNLYHRIKTFIIGALLKLIEADRRGIDVDHSLLKEVIQSIVALGVDPRAPTQFYSDQFEDAFLKATKAFYSREVSEKLGDKKSLPAYMIHIEKRLDEEQRRLNQYLDKSTSKGLMKTLIEVTIDAHTQTLLDASKEWFDKDKVPEQRRLFTLLEQSDGGLEPLRKLIEDRIDSEGKATIMKNRNEALKDPCVYVEAIFTVYKKYRAMVEDIFQDHPHFKAALDKGCKRFINKNAIATVSGAKSADLLAKYAHMLLKPSSRAAKARTEEELDETLGEVLTIFALLEDVDVFQRVYRDKLSQRLIHNTYSQEQETVMISKLKTVCGYEYTYKLQRMFTDMGLSKEINKEFEEWSKVNEPVNPNIPPLITNVLTSVSWPQTASKVTFNVPPVLKDGLDHFSEFYRRKYQGRSLSWLHAQSNGILKTNYIPAKAYELQVSTQQATTLLCLNDPARESITWAELIGETHLPEKDLEFCLQVLVRQKVLSLVGASSPPPDLKGATVKVNSDFASNTRKVQLYNAQHREGQQAEDVATMKVVSEDRKYSIQAAIVRLMKARKTINHQCLVTEVATQLRDTFTPSNQDIKKNIENLIEKEYLERASDGKSYTYLA